MERQLETNKLLGFLDGSPTQFHAAANVMDALQRVGYVRLFEDRRWELTAGGRYFVSRNESSVIAFCVPRQPMPSMPFRMVAVHLDSPLLKLKLKGLELSKTCIYQIPVDVYGGPIISTWLDRPLGIAGLLCQGTENRLFNLPDVAVIPNAAVHFNRSINDKGAVYNPQTELNAIVGCAGFIGLESLAIPEDAADDSELFLYDSTKATLLGPEHDMINASRLDNLLSAFAALVALPEHVAENSQCVPLAFFADNEEVGSLTLQGADSNFLPCVLQRILCAFNGSHEDFCISMASSRMISADAAHAEHPSYTKYYEPNYAPKMGHGIALKKNTKFRYASNGRDCAWFRALCDNAGIPCQDFINRADMPCGSTVGASLSATGCFLC